MNDLPRVRFHGRFRELIPAGFVFHKLFARNYRCYWKEIGPDDIKIWQHLGGYVEINDFYNYSCLIIDAILADRPFKGFYDQFAINKHNRTIEPFDFERHDPSMFRGDRQEYEKHCDRWRWGSIQPETEAYIREMGRLGWIVLEPR